MMPMIIIAELRAADALTVSLVAELDFQASPNQ